MSQYDNCDKCRYKELRTNKYPCNQCKNNYIDKYEPLPDLNTGDLVTISEECQHNIGYRGQLGIVMKFNRLPCNDINENYYYVLAYDKRANRYWECGFNRSELTQIDGNFNDLIKVYKHWEKQ